MRFISLLLIVLTTIITEVSYAEPGNVTGSDLQTGPVNTPTGNTPFKVHGRFGLWSFTMPVNEHQMLGAGFDIQLCYSPRFSVGFSLSTNLKSIHDGLGIPAGMPLLNYFDVNIYQEFKIVSKKAVALNARFYTGSASLSLHDGSILEPHVVQDYDPNSNGTHIEMRPKRIAVGSFYRLAPALVTQIRLIRNVELEAVGGYNFYCNSSFGNQKSLNGYFVQFGLKFGRMD